MTLREYLTANQVTLSSFAKLIGVTRVAVHYWVRGTRVPRGSHMVQIVAVTGGSVTPNDFLPPAAPAAE